MSFLEQTSTFNLEFFVVSCVSVSQKGTFCNYDQVLIKTIITLEEVRHLTKHSSNWSPTDFDITLGTEDPSVKICSSKLLCKGHTYSVHQQKYLKYYHNLLEKVITRFECCLN